MIFVVATDGILYSISDNGSFGEIQWTRNLAPYKVITAARYVPEVEKVYVGTDFGTCHQINIFNGSNEGFALMLNNLAPLTGNVMSNLVIDYSTLSFPDIIGANTGPGGGAIKSYILPFNQNLFACNFPGGWENPSNWSSGSVPNAETRVVIAPGCTVSISSHAVCKSILLRAGANVQVNDGFSLTVAGQ